MAMMDFALTILQPDTKSKRPLNLLIMSTKVLILSIELMLMVFVITGNSSKTFNAKINECNWLELFRVLPKCRKRQEYSKLRFLFNNMLTFEKSVFNRRKRNLRVDI